MTSKRVSATIRMVLAFLSVLACFVSSSPAFCTTYGFDELRRGHTTMSILLNDPNKKIGYSFILPQTKTLSSVRFYVESLVGPSFPLLVELRNDHQGLPGDIVLASATVAPTGNWTSPTANIRTTGGQPYTSVANTKYHVVIRPDGQNGSFENYVRVPYQIDDHYILDPIRSRPELDVALDFGQGWFNRPFADALVILTCSDGTRYGCAEVGAVGYSIQGTGNDCRQGQVFTATASMTVRKVWLGVTCTPNVPSRKQFRPDANLILVIQNLTTGLTLVNEPFIAPKECSTWNAILYSHVLQNPIDIVANHQYKLYVTQEGGGGRNDADCLQYYKILGKQFTEAALSYEGTTSYSFYETGAGVTYTRNPDIYFRLDSARVEMVRINQFLATPSGIVIVAESKEPTNAILEYGPGASYGNVLASDAKTIHEFSISGLASGSRYNYRLQVINPSDSNDTIVTGNCTFNTTPESGTIRVGVIGDTQSMDHNPMVQVMAAHPYDLILMSGDLVGMDDLTIPDNEELYEFGMREWRWLLQALTPVTKNAPLYTTLGNHDYPWKSNALRAYQDSVIMPMNGSEDERNYSFDYGPAHFTFLDNANRSIPAEQLNWLRSDLQSSQKHWKIVVLHYPVYGAESDWSVRDHEMVHSVLRDGGVSLVIQGHRHVYNRYYKDGICYVTNGVPSLWGSGGYPDGIEKGAVSWPDILNTGGDPGTISRYIVRPGWTQLEISDTHIRGQFIGILNQPFDAFTLPSSMLVTFNPDGGSFPSASTTVTINCDDPDAIIHFTTDGREPTEQDQVIASGDTLLIDRNLTLKAKAFKPGCEPGDTKSSDFLLTGVATPTFTPDGGVYETCLDVVVTCATPGATIFYTVDGAEPTTSSPMVTSGQTISVDQTITLKAKGFKSGMSASDTKTAAYTVGGGLPLVFVSADGDDGASGASWKEAKQRIQTAIDVVAEGGEVWVKQGTYYENIRMRDNRRVLGGFSGTEASLYQRNPWLYTTTINGGAAGSVVTAHVNVTNLARLDGFLITGGSGTSAYNSYYGGGVYCLGSPTISGNKIIGNYAQYGGGIFLGGDSGAIVENNFIRSNNGGAFGGGVMCASTSSPVIKHNTFTGNGNHFGSGVYCGGGSPMIANNIVAFNASGIYVDDISLPVLRSNCVYGNDSYNYSFGVLPGVGDISVDPRLANGSTDYHLLPESPCIDTGDAEYSSAGDLEGGARPVDGNSDGNARPDIGCSEWCRKIANPSSAKRLSDYVAVRLEPSIVTAILSDRFYVQTTDRTRGIGVLGDVASIGAPVSLDGLMTTIDGERLVAASAITEHPSVTPLEPIFMSLLNLGGRANYRQSGVVAWRSQVIGETVQRLIQQPPGINNIGLLVKVIGKVRQCRLTHFFIDDGFGMEEADPSTVGVRVDWPYTQEMPAEGSIVELTAISSCTTVTVDGTEYVVRMLRPVGPDAAVVIRGAQ